MRLFFAALSALALLLLSACGGQTGGYSYKADDNGMIPLRVGTASAPHAEILRHIAPALAEQGIALEVVEYDDYLTPNAAVERHELAANYFQHAPHLNDFNAANSAHLKQVVAVHYEPLGLYPGRADNLSDLPNGGLIGIPGGSAGGARALQLLGAQGLIRLRAGAGLSATPDDVVENPKDLRFQVLEAAMLPRMTQDLDMAVLNSTDALHAGFSSARDALALEDAASEAARTYANILVVYAGDERQTAIRALAGALTSESARAFIEDTYCGSVLPMF